MLSPDNRLTAPAHFREVVRRGRRCGGPLLVVHLLVGFPVRRDLGLAGGPRVGFVVSKAVGPAVTRNLVKRRLRHLARARTTMLPAEAMLVVRALPAAAEASFAELGAELDRCTKRCLDRVAHTSGQRPVQTPAGTPTTAAPSSLEAGARP